MESSCWSAVSTYLLFAGPSPRALRVTALLYGVAMALTFDEFGMWLHLGGSYWQRASVDAIVVVAALLALGAFALDIRQFEARHLVVSLILLVGLAILGVTLYDASAVAIGRIAGPQTGGAGRRLHLLRFTAILSGLVHTFFAEGWPV